MADNDISYENISEESADQFYDELYLVGQLNNNNELTGQLSAPLQLLSGILDNQDALSGAISNATLRGYSAYDIAVLQGYEGTEAEWLESLKAEELQIRNNYGVLQYKYKNDLFWTDLVDLNEFVGDYEKLINKPSLDGQTLMGNRDLFETYYEHDDVLSNMDIEELLGF